MTIDKIWIAVCDRCGEKCDWKSYKGSREVQLFARRCGWKKTKFREMEHITLTDVPKPMSKTPHPLSTGWLCYGCVRTCKKPEDPCNSCKFKEGYDCMPTRMDWTPPWCACYVSKRGVFNG